MESDHEDENMGEGDDDEYATVSEEDISDDEGDTQMKD